jgi:hypothetical protein
MQHVLDVPLIELFYGFFCLRNIVVGIRHDANEHSYHYGSIARRGDNYLREMGLIKESSEVKFY